MTMITKIFPVLALVLLMAACTNDAKPAADGTTTTEAPKAKPTNPAIKTMTGELEANYKNAMLSVDALTINYMSTEGDSVQAVVAFMPEKRTCRVPVDYLVPVPGAAEGSIMPNPAQTNQPVILVLQEGKVTEVRIK